MINTNKTYYLEKNWKCEDKLKLNTHLSDIQALYKYYKTNLMCSAMTFNF